MTILAKLILAHLLLDYSLQGKCDALIPGWTTLAEALLRRFLREHPEPFIAEEFAAWAEAQGLPEPHDSRAYGPLMNRAARASWIVKAGYRVDKWHSPKACWMLA